MLDPVLESSCARYYVDVEGCDKDALNVSRVCGERQADGNHGAFTGKSRHFMRMLNP